MSQFNRRDLSKKTEKLQKEIANSSPLWGKTIEEEQKDMQRVKKKWQQKQHQQYNRLQYQQKEKKNIKTIISSLVTVTIVAVVIPYIPHWWQLTANFMSESFSPDAEKTLEATSEKNLDNLLIKLKDIDDNQALTEVEKQIIRDNPQLLSCSVEANECNIEQINNAPDDQGNSVNQLIDKLQKINQKMNLHQDRLQKAIDMSDGKNVSLEEK